jgi:hypothetical protein
MPGKVIAEASNDVNILAANQWKATPLHLGLEMLAAHVQPNASAVGGLMPEVSDRLNAATGRSAIDSYQTENPERVDAIAQAVYGAMRAGHPVCRTPLQVGDSTVKKSAPRKKSSTAGWEPA